MRSMTVNQASLTSTVAAQLQPEDVPSLRSLVVAGELLTREVVERWADHVQVINMYGPAKARPIAWGTQTSNGRVIPVRWSAAWVR